MNSKLYQRIPEVYEQNKQRWSHLLLKTKGMQDLMNDFTYKIKTVLEKEITNNKDQLTHYIMHPRVSSLSRATANKIKEKAEQ